MLICSALFALAAACAIAQQTSIVSNVEPRRDFASGRILDVHDGQTIRIGDTFFWYGAGYGNCTEMATGCKTSKVGACGFQLNHTVNLATSTDLTTWTFHGPVLPESARPEGIMFSPFVARSNATGKYVMWVNILPVVDGHGDFSASRYSVATADSPYGPFEVVRGNVTGLAYKQLPDAPSIFVDDDGQGYVAFTHETSHVNHVQRLAPDLLGPASPSAVSPAIGPGNREGIAMFKRGGLYYIVVGQCCCFCAAGTGVEVYTASAPLGAYSFRGQVARYPSNGSSIWMAQTGTVWHTGRDWVLFGDRWQSAPDRVKAHDFSYMTPLSFRPDGSIESIGRWQDQVAIRF